MSKRKRDKKNQFTEVKTYSVPSKLEKIKENITFNTISPSKPSKEQIINQAIQFHLQGNIKEAIKFYQYCIGKGFNDYRIFSNYAGILMSSGKLESAEILLRKAI